MKHVDPVAAQVKQRALNQHQEQQIYQKEDDYYDPLSDNNLRQTERISEAKKIKR